VADGRAFFPALNLPTTYSSTALVNVDFTGGTGQLVALDVATGDQLWVADIPAPIYAGATVTNDLVWTSGLDAVVRAYNVADGTLAFSFQAPNGINGTFAAEGDILLVPAAAFFVPSSDTPVPDAATESVLVAYKLGATPIAPPAAAPASATPSA
jgi:outer membrane protein assembly factor BamB